MNIDFKFAINQSVVFIDVDDNMKIKEGMIYKADGSLENTGKPNLVETKGYYIRIESTDLLAQVKYLREQHLFNSPDELMSYLQGQIDYDHPF
jgi:hypothetical protein